MKLTADSWGCVLLTHNKVKEMVILPMSTTWCIYLAISERWPTIAELAKKWTEREEQEKLTKRKQWASMHKDQPYYFICTEIFTSNFTVEKRFGFYFDQSERGNEFLTLENILSPPWLVKVKSKCFFTQQNSVRKSQYV